MNSLEIYEFHLTHKQGYDITLILCGEIICVYFLSDSLAIAMNTQTILAFSHIGCIPSVD